MADPAWPDQLPRPTTTYGYSPSSGAIETDMENGYVLVRRRFTAHATLIPVTWRLIGNNDLTGTQKLGIFEEFFWGTLQAGTLYFTTTVLTGRGLVQARCQFVHGQDGSQVYSPKLDPNSFDVWDVSATLRTYISLRSS